MHLYFVRHGLATWPLAAHYEDDARPLTPAGADLMRAASAGLLRRLDARSPRPEVILHSPLTRARQTAEILAAALAPAPLYPHPLLRPGCELPLLDALISERPERGALLLVGHNPDFADMVSALTGAPVRFREGTMAHVRRPAKGRAELVWIAAAEALAAA